MQSSFIMRSRVLNGTPYTSSKVSFDNVLRDSREEEMLLDEVGRIIFRDPSQTSTIVFYRKYFRALVQFIFKERFVLLNIIFLYLLSLTKL